MYIVTKKIPHDKVAAGDIVSVERSLESGRYKHREKPARTRVVPRATRASTRFHVHLRVY